MKETNELDATLSNRSASLGSPAGRIYAATQIIDQFLQMVAGVHDFHPNSNLGNSNAPEYLSNITKKYFDIFSLLRNNRRAKALSLENSDSERVLINVLTLCVEHMIAALMDNAWKYSVDNSLVVVSVSDVGRELVDITITNSSKPIPDDLDIFERGVRGDIKSDGFGFGLFWARMLSAFYNDVRQGADAPCGITHRQEIDGDGAAKQYFTIHNVASMRMQERQ